MQTTAFLIVLAGLILVVGTVLAIVGLRNAPEGYEDENGFQFAPAPDEILSASVVSFADAQDAAGAHEPAHSGELELAA